MALFTIQECRERGRKYLEEMASRVAEGKAQSWDRDGELDGRGVGWENPVSPPYSTENLGERFYDGAPSYLQAGAGRVAMNLRSVKVGDRVEVTAKRQGGVSTHNSAGGTAWVPVGRPVVVTVKRRWFDYETGEHAAAETDDGQPIFFGEFDNVVRKVASGKLGAIAERVAGKVVSDILSDTLKDIQELMRLEENVSLMIENFDTHFYAGINIEVKSQQELENKAHWGWNDSAMALQKLKAVLERFPGDKKVERAIRNAEQLVELFKKHKQSANKIVNMISKKEMPESLKQFASKVVSKLKTKLVDLDTINLSYNQEDNYNGGVAYTITIELIVQMADVRYSNSKEEPTKWSFTLQQDTAGEKLGPYEKYTKVDTVDGVMMFLEERLGKSSSWKGAISQRQERTPIAEEIRAAFSEALHSVPSIDIDNPVIDATLTTIHGSFRSPYISKDEPQHSEQARAISEWRPKMVDLQKRYKNQIKKIGWSFGEKSWIYTQIDLM